MFSESPKIISMVFESSLSQFSSISTSIPAEMSNPIIFFGIRLCQQIAKSPVPVAISKIVFDLI
jgi:hypothetical protein